MAAIASIVAHREQRGGGGRERDALREALAVRAAAKLDAACHRTAVDRARDLVSAAERKVARAAKGVEEAKAESTRLAVEAVSLGRDDVSGAGIVRAARAGEVQEQDGCDMARAVLAQLQSSTPTVDGAVLEADVAVSMAVNAVLLPVARAAFDRLKEIDRERYQIMGMLRHVQEANREKVSSSPLGSTHMLALERKLHAVLDGLCKELSDHFGRSLVPELRDLAPWRDAREQLRVDADAKLPAL
jgi:hypothetical protein